MYNVDWQYPKDENNRYEPFLWQSEWYKLFTDPADARKTLTWRDNFSSARKDNVYTFFAPTDEAFRPFKVTIDDMNTTPLPNVTATNPGQVYDGSKSKGSIMLTMLGEWVHHWFDSERLGTYGFVYNELLKGSKSIVMPDSKYGGWGFNMDQSDNYNRYVCSYTNNCTFEYVKPGEANLLDRDPTATDPGRNILKSKPFFNKGNGNGYLYTPDPVNSFALTAANREKLLANEIPALTFAVGHRGVEDARINNIDIRDEYLVQKKAAWPRPPQGNYEWRHSDFINVAYPYLFRLFDKFKDISQPVLGGGL